MEKKESLIKPFKGLRYNPEAAGEIAGLLAPPYDVISPSQQEELYQRSQNNVVRLILGKVNQDDTESDNRYTRAAEHLAEWIKKGILLRDEKPAIYVYAQTYTVMGEEKVRVGFVARKRLEEFGGSIVPHENTLSGPKTDRLNLTRACKCNFSQIFGLYTDKTKITDALLKEIISTTPDVDAITDDGIRQRLWVVTDKAWISRIVEAVGEKSIMIADGHHRYETALNYLKENSVDGKTPTEDMKYVMMYFTNTESDGLSILPTHRVVHSLKNLNTSDFLKKAEEKFEIETIPSSNGHRNANLEEILCGKMKTPNIPSFGLYIGKGQYAVLKYRKGYQGGPLESLDVGILHTHLMEAILGIGPKELAEQTNVKYTIDMMKAAEQVDNGESQMAFFLNSTPIEHMWNVANAGLKMPQKSTYFYPKLITGLVMNPLY